MRFAMVTTYYPPYHFGGDAVFVHRLVEALAGMGHHVDVVYSQDAWRLGRGAEPAEGFSHHANVRLHGLTCGSGLGPLTAHQTGRPAAYSRRLREILHDGAYDVIHFHNVSLMGGPGVLTLGRGVKLYTAHEYWLVCPTHVLFSFQSEPCTRKRCLRCTLRYLRPPQMWRYTSHLERCLSSLDALLVPSQFAMERHRADGITVPMELMPCFVPEPTDAPPPEKPHRPYFLYVGRLEKLKGLQDIVPLFRTYREADLLVAGSGAYERVLRWLARDLPHVRFLGRLQPEELQSLYRGAIALLAPSICYETFGLTIAEALVHGTPAIARRIGALEEILEQTGGGLLFSNARECLQAMERLRADEGLRRTLGERGREEARRRFSRKVHVERYLELVDRIAVRKGVASPAREHAPA